MRITRTAALAVAALVATSCVSVNKSVLRPGLPPVPEWAVQVFFETDSIPEHTRVAILHASGSSGFTDEAEMIDRLREEAGKLGANAIILSGIKEPGAGEKFVNYLASGWVDGERRGGALAIWVPSLAKEQGSGGEHP